MPSHILTDVANDLWVDSFSLHAGPCSVTKRTLRGGRRDAVDLVRLDNGAFSVDIVPTRGMSLHRGDYKGTRIGWTSAVTDGPVNPKFVNLMAWGGLGWLEGYDEMLVNAAASKTWARRIRRPVQSISDGTRRDVLYGLHGRIGNIPAHYVAVHHDEKTGSRITVEGQYVDESKPFVAPQVGLEDEDHDQSPGSNKLVVRDEYVNLRESPRRDARCSTIWNVRHADPRGRCSGRRADQDRAAPRQAGAGGDGPLRHLHRARGRVRRAGLFLRACTARGKDGRTIAMLRNRAGDKGVALRYSLAALPAFTVWKNTAGLKEGYGHRARTVDELSQCRRP